MKMRYLAFAALPALLLVCLGLLLSSPPADPVWNGRTLTAWTDDLAYGSSKEIREAAEDALHALGAKAIPQLLHMLCQRDTAMNRCLAWLNRKQTLVQFAVTPARRDHLRAWVGFEALGDAGETAIPELRRMLLRNPNAEFVPEALAAISARSVPVLLEVIPRVPTARRCEIFQAALKWPSQEPLIVSALERALADRDPQVRACAASFLGRCRANSALAASALHSVLHDSEAVVRAQASASLAQLGKEMATP